MFKMKRKVDRFSISDATDGNNRHMSQLREKIEQFDKDEEKESRLKLCLCKHCYYVFTDRFGGSAMTRTECGICGTDMLFGSTNTDVICHSCGKENGLCAHCGADIELKKKRKPYPFMVKEGE